MSAPTPRHARRFSEETMQRMAAMRKKGYSWRFIANFFNLEDEREARAVWRAWQRRKEREQ